MDETNLKTASLYINNQLLSRGLLRNGQTIDFARPDRGEGGLEATMGRVMGVVNDLILRRDRDATQRENLTTSIRTLKADSLRQTTELERLHAKFAESQRKLGIAEATERALKLQIKSEESKERGLKEEMARMKELVKQTRNQCAVEVRKRERMIEGLKKHVGDGRVRGGGKNPGTREVVVVGGVGEKEVKATEGGVPVGEEGYDLRSETNEFLTELARGLSEENENLAALARRTLENLKTLSGWERDSAEGPGGMVVEMEMGYEALAADMEGVIEHVRTLLTNPSFVPLEEVEVREEEIIRLREGWERMESRWREAVQMMDGWRKRMARSGQTVNLEELKMGMSLSPLKTKDEEKAQAFQLSVLEEEGEGDTQADIDAMDEISEPGLDEEMDDSDSSMFEEDPMEEEEPQEQEATFNTESSAVSPPQLSPLKETSGNRHVQTPTKEKEGFTTIVEENTYDLLQLATSPEKPKPKPQSVKSTPQSAHPSRQQVQTLATPPEDEVALLSTSLPSQDLPLQNQESSTRSSPQKSTNSNTSARSNPTPRLRMGPESRLPRPRDPAPQQSPLTMASIAAKLAASEREADAARVRAKLRAARMGRVGSAGSKLVPVQKERETIRRVEDETECGDDAQEEVQIEKDNEMEREREAEGRSRKRKATMIEPTGRRDRDTGRAKAKTNRRRSTLSPWELESLILGGLGGSPEKGS